MGLCPGNPWEIVGNRLENQPNKEVKNEVFIYNLPHPRATQSCFSGGATATSSLPAAGELQTPWVARHKS